MEHISATTTSTVREYVSYHLDVGASSHRSCSCQKIKKQLHGASMFPLEWIWEPTLCTHPFIFVVSQCFNFIPLISPLIIRLKDLSILKLNTKYNKIWETLSCFQRVGKYFHSTYSCNIVTTFMNNYN